MDDTVKQLLKGISIAGLFHDIGKFAERANAISPSDPDQVRQDYNYAHAHHTELALKRLFPEQRLGKHLGDGSLPELTLLNLASRHHKPRNAYETIISEADRIASGHERAKADDDSAFETSGRERKKQVPLLSILGRVCLPEHLTERASANMRYRLRVPIPDKNGDLDQLYPVLPEDYPGKQVELDYISYWQKFESEIKGNALDLLDHFDTIIEICRYYQWCLPASARKEEIEDVSMFEHQKATAALAACLYAFHADNGTLDTSSIKDRKVQKFLLFCGDVSGIQKFIYQISSKGAYKTLKGRSFYVQLLAETLARRVASEFSLTPINILYASGGKFYLLLPNTEEVKSRLADLTDAINGELFYKFNGDLYIRTGWEALSGEDLTRQSGRMLYQIWDALGRDVMLRDRQRYASLAGNNYQRFFGAHLGGRTNACKVCHAAMQPRNDSEEQTCPACNQMFRIGHLLNTTACIVVSEDNAAMAGKPLFEICGRYFWLVEQGENLAVHRPALVFVLNDSGFAGIVKINSLSTVNAAPLIVGGTHRFEKETFDEIADSTEGGFKRLGILRMDVDDLGKIFNHGLRHYRHAGNQEGEKGRFHSLGRITTLSWQLGLFFGALVPGIIGKNPSWKERVSVVYSGGDDLFLLGAWDVVPDIALEIRNQFRRYACGNPSFSLSGGIALTGGKFPIYKSAELAGDAEHAAKVHETVWRGGEATRKSSLSFLETTMHWEEFAAVQGMKERLMPLLRDPAKRPIISRLRDIASSWRESRDGLQRSGETMTLQEIRRCLDGEKWRWQMVYSLARFASDKKEIKEDIGSLQQFILGPVAGTDRQGIELLGVLSRWCELLNRKSDRGKGERDASS